jgi:nucleoside-diphosphate-sugar epimerase
MRVLVTGASGFVGRALVARFAAEPGLVARAATRRDIELPHDVEVAHTGQLDAATDWSAALRDVDVVVHAAARVHVMRDTSTDPLAEFRRVNVAGTMALARQAAQAGARRFVFLSSIKVNGERTSRDRPFTAADAPSPRDPYGVSKLEAENALRELAEATGLEVVIVRPVLVYGPGVKGNFLAMLRWISRGVPLPLGAADNRRSFVALDNLTDLVATVLRHPSAANRTFLASDGEDLSTAEMLRRVGVAMDRRARLLPVPPAALRFAMRLLGKGPMAQRLLESLQVDIEPTRSLLGWTPPVSVDQGLRATAEWFTGARATSHGSAPLHHE